MVRVADTASIPGTQVERQEYTLSKMPILCSIPHTHTHTHLHLTAFLLSQSTYENVFGERRKPVNHKETQIRAHPYRQYPGG